MEPAVARAQELLGVAFDRVEPLVPAGRRHRVLRCRCGGNSVVVKQVREGAIVELEALTLLQDTGRTPRILAADADLGLLVLEDLAGERLDQVLLRVADPDAARLLVELAAALGAVHRATLRDAAPPADELFSAVAFQRVCQDLGLPAGAVVEELEVGPLVALAQGDVGPDNCIATPDGLRLIDFELAGWRDPLLDAALWRLGFPTCGCAGAIPEPLLDEMDAVHEAALGRAVSAGERVRAQARWLCNRIARLFEWGVLDEDWTWGRAGGRQRVLALLRGFDGGDDLPAFTAQVRDLERVLRARWPGVPVTLPLYPALT